MDHIVVGDRVLLDASFRTARARLEILARDGMLLPWASEVAYGEGITALVKAAGPAAGLTRLAGARLDGKLFTALDADLMLVPAGDKHTTLALAGAYLPQPGLAGAGLDRAIVRSCTATAIRSFLARVACALAYPAGTAGPADHSPPRLAT